jgi:proline iminopeptidase
MNNNFLEGDQLLKNVSRLEGIPSYIIQGRYDMICPMKQAWDLHNSWNSSELIVVQGAGHAAGEMGISAALVKAGNDMLKQLRSNS